MASDLSCKKNVCKSIFAQLFLHHYFFTSVLKKMNFWAKSQVYFTSIRHVFYYLPLPHTYTPTSSFSRIERIYKRKKHNSPPSHQNNRSWVKVAEWKKVILARQCFLMAAVARKNGDDVNGDNMMIMIIMLNDHDSSSLHYNIPCHIVSFHISPVLFVDKRKKPPGYSARVKVSKANNNHIIKRMKMNRFLFFPPAIRFISPAQLTTTSEPHTIS